MDTKVVRIERRRGRSGARGEVRMKVINGLIGMYLGQIERGNMGWDQWSRHLLRV